VDYIQKLAGVETNEAVAAASMAVSNAAAAHNVPIIALSQLHRFVKDRSDRYDPRPTMADLRGSGALEQDARVICLLWNKCAPLRQALDVTPAEAVQKAEWSNKIRLILAKNSEGDVGEWDLGFEPGFGRFYSLDTNHKEVPF
jgi:replicative DNA helicase